MPGEDRDIDLRAIRSNWKFIAIAVLGVAAWVRMEFRVDAIETKAAAYTPQHLARVASERAVDHYRIDQLETKLANTRCIVMPGPGGL